MLVCTLLEVVHLGVFFVQSESLTKVDLGRGLQRL